ncbi:MAG: AAA family ATPase [Magnetococcales bacterium]|nr:AAA family ATPase [Magnetococcales bacterium]
MAMIEGFRIRNYRVLKDITMGRIGTDPTFKDADPLTSLVTVIGRNGAGKSTLFDAFGFLADCMVMDVETACNEGRRGGLEKLLSADVKDDPKATIDFVIYYREAQNERPITYEVSIGYHPKGGQLCVASEKMRQRRQGEPYGRPYPFLDLVLGHGYAWAGKFSVGEGEKEATDKMEVTLDPGRLAITTLAEHIKDHPRITKFRNFIKGWYLSYFTPDAARQTPKFKPERQLNLRGENIANVVYYMANKNSERFLNILERIGKKIPGIGKISPYVDPVTKNVYLQFHDKGFISPFFSPQMSDGTLKLFAYMLLLEDPEPAPFICIEEPENGLHHKLLADLAREFRFHATGRKNKPQLFITTHQPYFVDALTPAETWILEKKGNGFATISHASDNATIVSMVNEGIPLGNLWYSDYMDDETV